MAIILTIISYAQLLDAKLADWSQKIEVSIERLENGL